MLERSLIPVLLAGVLAVGCSTAQAQEREDAPEAAARDESVERDLRERQRQIEAVRARLTRAEDELAAKVARVREERDSLDNALATVTERQIALAKEAEALSDEARRLATESERLTRDGMGASHPRVVELRRAQTAIAEAQAALDARQHEVREQLGRGGPEYIRMAAESHELQREVAKLERSLRALETGVPLPPRGGVDRRFRGGERRGPQGRGAPRGDLGGGERGGGDGIAGRVARLERTVDELRGLLERHGFSEERRRLAMDEIDRRGADHPGPAGRRDRPGRAPERRSRDGLDGPERGPRGERPGEHREDPRPGAGERRRAPPGVRPPRTRDQGARDESDGARRELDRVRAENQELRGEMERMHRELEMMRRRFEEREDVEDREDSDR